jgi:hypothetical protein
MWSRTVKGKAKHIERDVYGIDPWDSFQGFGLVLE